MHDGLSFHDTYEERAVASVGTLEQEAEYQGRQVFENGKSVCDVAEAGADQDDIVDGDCTCQERTGAC